LDSLSSEIGLSVKQIRTALNKLERTGELAGSGMARGRMITVVNYSDYQTEGSLKASKGAGKGQGKGRVGATNNNDNNENNDNNIIIPDGINSNAYLEWIDFRNKKKKPISDLAAKKQFNFLSKYDYSTQQLIIDQSISNDYQGLFELKGANHDNQNQHRPNQPSPKLSVVERTRLANEERERARQARAYDGQTMAQVTGDLRSPIEQPVRDNDTGELGEVIDGHYTRADSEWP